MNNNNLMTEHGEPSCQAIGSVKEPSFAPGDNDDRMRLDTPLYTFLEVSAVDEMD
jgi:hypothetical protein